MADWSHETRRFIYRTPDPKWLTIRASARAFAAELLRWVDDDGAIYLRSGERHWQAAARMMQAGREDHDWVRRSLQALVDDGHLLQEPARIVIRNFKVAQEILESAEELSKQRSKEAIKKARQRAAKRGDQVEDLVYFVRRESGGPVKIGHSENVGARLDGIRHEIKEAVIVLSTESGGASREAELHERFAAFRLGGEWFEAEPVLAYLGHVPDPRPRPTSPTHVPDPRPQDADLAGARTDTPAPAHAPPRASAGAHSVPFPSVPSTAATARAREVWTGLQERVGRLGDVDPEDLGRWCSELGASLDLPADASAAPYVRHAMAKLADLVTAKPATTTKDRLTFASRTVVGLVNDDKQNRWASGRTDGREGVCAPAEGAPRSSPRSSQPQPGVASIADPDELARRRKAARGVEGT